MTIYLYKKTHNKTGLQYLGKTIQDPFKYKGSGKDWKSHLTEHGRSVKTEILKECSSQEELSYWGRYYSELWDVVNSSEWANRMPETGGGPGFESGENHPNFGKKQSTETIEKRTSQMRGKTYPGRGSGAANGFFGKSHSDENKMIFSDIAKMRVGEKNGMFGKSHPEETRQKMKKNHADVSGDKNPNFGKKKSPDEIARRNETRTNNRLNKLKR